MSINKIFKVPKKDLHENVDSKLIWIRFISIINQTKENQLLEQLLHSTVFFISCIEVSSIFKCGMHQSI